MIVDSLSTSPFLASLSLVTLAELGDKTQLLSFVLAARWPGRQWAIILGIFIATIVNHALAAWLGQWAALAIDSDVIDIIVGVAFLAFAVWALIPDQLEEEPSAQHRSSAFLAAMVLFFIAEMGDKTQLATVALGAQYSDVLTVTVGTTLGMMVANVPAVMVGESLTKRFPLRKMRFVAAALFAVFGVAALLGK